MRGLVMVLAAVGLACEWPTDVGTGAKRLPEDRGELIASANGYGLSIPEWTQAGGIFFEGMTVNAVGPRRYTLSTVPPQSKSATQVYDFGSTLFSITGSPDAAWVYVGVNSGGSAPPSLHRVRSTGDSVALVTSRLNQNLREFLGATTSVLATPDGASVVYTVTADSLFVLSAANGASRFVTSGCTRLAVISPKSDTIVCIGGTGYRKVDLMTGGSTALAASNTALVGARRFRWDSAGIHIVHTEGADVWVTDLATQTSRKTPFDSTQGLLDLGKVAWSADGRRVAWFRYWCLDLGFNSCESQYAMYVLYLDTFTVRRVAVVTVPASAPQPTRLALDLHGETAAYVFNDALYFKAIPPP